MKDHKLYHGLYHTEMYDLIIDDTVANIVNGILTFAFELRETYQIKRQSAQEKARFIKQIFWMALVGGHHPIFCCMFYPTCIIRGGLIVFFIQKPLQSCFKNI